MRVSIIGSGNVASHLAKACVANSIELINIYSKSIVNAERLAVQCQAKAISTIGDLSTQIDLLIVAINDDALPHIAAELSTLNVPIVHTAGSTSMSVFASAQHYGVLYPLQTFSKSKEIDITHVPFLIEANSETVYQLLEQFCSTIGAKHYQASSEQRLNLHIAAVFACNFSNHMYTIAEQLLIQHQLPFDLLKPLIQETAQKIQTLSPIQAQTGPAKRHDALTMQKHLEALAQNPALYNLYKSISEEIEKNQNS